jgi:signal transduction histidine kinase/ActR/RegA family two-component response regulator
MDTEQRDSLRSSLRDLVALSTLPGLWIGRPVPAIVSGLVDVAVSISRLDLAYARVEAEGDEPEIEAAGGNQPRPLTLHAGEIGRALGPWLRGDVSATGVELPHPAGIGTLRFVFIPFGLDGAQGVLAAGSRRPDFPTEVDTLVLGVAVNQAMICIRSARATAERDRSERALGQRALQLRGLTKAAAAMNSLALEEALRVITDEAREIIGTHQAITSLTVNQSGTVSFSERYAAWRQWRPPADGSGVPPLLCRDNRVVRMTQAELEEHPAWRGRSTAVPHPPLRGLLAAPLTARNGRHVGCIQLSDKVEGEFTADDEALLVQLAQMASVAVENAQLFRQAEETNHAKDVFLATLSHELRTPLNAIVGWTALLKAGALDERTTARALDVIDRNSRHQSQLIEDLLDVSRIIEGKVVLATEPVSLPSVIDAAVESVAPAARAKGIELDVVAGSGVAPVSGDANRLQQVVWNLLSNALKFTPTGGRVEVRCRTRDERVELTVADTGCGMPPEALGYIFERFRQRDTGTRRAYGGLGLGLAIVRYLVELHGGTVTAHSAGVSQGATFTVLLPTMPGRPVPLPAVDQPQADEIRLNGLCVLVVEDEPDTRELLCHVLEQSGADVTAVGSAREGMDVMDALRPDVIVSDIGMPGEDGYGLIRHVRKLQRGAAVPAIALTAFASADDRALAEEAGFDLHLVKPVEPSAIVEAVAILVAQHRR